MPIVVLQCRCGICRRDLWYDWDSAAYQHNSKYEFEIPPDTCPNKGKSWHITIPFVEMEIINA